VALQCVLQILTMCWQAQYKYRHNTNILMGAAAEHVTNTQCALASTIKLCLKGTAECVMNTHHVLVNAIKYNNV
jgi:hypothetical protein